MTMSLRLEIRQADGQVDELTVDSGRVLIGSGAQCEVRLPPDVAETEHLAIVVNERALFAEVSASRGGVTVGGAPFTRGQVESGSVFAVGKVLLRVSLVDRPDVAGRRKSRSPTGYLIAIMLFAVVYYALFRSKRAESALAKAPKHPDLWSTATVACPQKARDPARRLATDLAELADSKRERAPFVPQAGVSAVTLYREAAACMLVAGDKASAALLSQEGEALGGRMVDAFHVSRLRLERAIESQDWETARWEAEREKSFLDAQRGDYVTWLKDVENRSTIKLAKLAKKKKSKW
jgi:hypothetical protein